MIPSITLIKEKIIEQYPPSGCGGTSPGSRKNIDVGGGASPSIINDIPGRQSHSRSATTKSSKSTMAIVHIRFPRATSLRIINSCKVWRRCLKKSPRKIGFLSHDRVSGRRPGDIRTRFSARDGENSTRHWCSFSLLAHLKILGLGSFKKEFKNYSSLEANRDGTSGFTTAGTVQTKPPILSPAAHISQRSKPKEG